MKGLHFKDRLEPILTAFSSSSLLIIIKKTFLDLFTIKKFLLSLLVMILPIFFLFSPPSSINFGSLSVRQVVDIISSGTLALFFMWTFGIAYTSLIGILGAPLIAEELRSGTMLVLVSKPIKRISIFLGKYVALFVFGCILSFVSLFTALWVIVMIYSGNLIHFMALSRYFLFLFTFSIFLLFIFASIALALSSIFRNPRISSLIIIFLMVFSYLGFPLIQSLFPDFYESNQLYHFDLNYHLGNIYVYFLEQFKAIEISYVWQKFFVDYTKVYTKIFFGDIDQNLGFGTLIKTNFYLPQISLLIWILLSIIFLVFGIIRMRIRDISGV